MGLGRRGPIPKDPEQRIRRNKTTEDGIETDSYDLEGEVVIPTAYFMNPYVNDIWLSLKDSVNRKFYEPVDWAFAKYTLYLIDQSMQGDKIPGPGMLTVFDSMLSKMLVNPADRRRLKIEADRASMKGQDGKVISAQDLFRERFENQRQA
jgi:hypothetical protein